MKKCWFNSMLFNKKLEHRCGLSKSMDSLDALGHTDRSEEPFLNDAEKKIPSWDSSSLSNIHYLNYFFDSRNILSLIYDDTFLVRNSNGDSYSLYFDIENQIFDIDNAISFLSELDIFFSNYLNSGSNSINYYSYDTKSNWNNHINSCIDTYLLFEISLYSGIDSYIKSFICTESEISNIESENLSIESEISNIESEISNIESEISNIESENLSIESEISNIESENLSIESENLSIESEISNIESENLSTESEISNDFDRTAQYKELWVLCENCYGLNYKKFFSSKMNICEYCGDHLKMSSSDRIKLLIDPGTWESMDEDMVSVDPIEFDSIDSIEFDSIDSIEFDSIDPNSIDPNSIDPNPIDFNSIDPNPIDPNPIDPNPIDPNSIDPNPIDFNSIDPNPIDPNPIDFNSIDPNSIDSNSIDFNSIDPNSIDSNSIDFNSIDPNSIDPNSIDSNSIESDSEEEEPYRDRIPSYQRKTGLTEAVQTGIGKLNSIPVAIGVMDFQFMGGSMGSVVGEKITRLIEYATNRSLPVIIVCASGGARMQEGSLSLMQMAKISSASYDYQSNKKLFYISILTSPTTGGVTASFGMLGDIIIAEPNAHIAFAGKRVIEEILKTPVPDGLQVAENSFDKGLFDPIVPRNPLKGVLNELFQLHGFLPLNQD
uniref:Acetyl-coenzyme A carboxylase carboxyl transferase subunit beta, chloroplastic n=8 Tax=Orchidaceae TaxID=4747 RepID=A0A8F5P7K7_9ASPA|nr:acetyl-CoA carboxylase carboxyl transferase [Hetaeria youngsayei]